MTVALAIAKLTDSESDSDTFISILMVTMPTTPTRNRDFRLTKNAQLRLILSPSKLISIISLNDAVAIIQCDDLSTTTAYDRNESVILAILLPLTPDEITWSGWCGINIIVIIMLLNLYK